MPIAPAPDSNLVACSSKTTKQASLSALRLDESRRCILCHQLRARQSFAYLRKAKLFESLEKLVFSAAEQACSSGFRQLHRAALLFGAAAALVVIGDNGQDYEMKKKMCYVLLHLERN